MTVVVPSHVWFTMEAGLLAGRKGPLAPLRKNKWNNEDDSRPHEMPFHMHLEKGYKVV